MQRYLDGRPVTAHRDSASYRLKKFVDRNRYKTLAASLIALLLIVGAALTAYQANQIANERDRVRIEAARAESVTQFLSSLFREADPFYSTNDSITVRELLEKGSLRIESELSDQPHVQATLYGVVGNAFKNLGNYELARTPLGRCIALYKQINERGDGLIKALHSLASIENITGEYERSQALFEELLTIVGENRGEKSTKYLTVLFDLASVLHMNGEREYADSLYDRWEELNAQISVDGLSNKEVGELADGTMNMADVAYARREYEKALLYARESVRLFEKFVGSNDHPSIAAGLTRLGWILNAKRDYEEAENVTSRSVEMNDRFFPEGHRETAAALATLAEAEQGLGKLEEAEAHYRRNLELRLSIFGSDHHTVAVGKTNLAGLLQLRGKYDESEKLLKESHAYYERHFDYDFLMAVKVRAVLSEVYLFRGEKKRVRELIGPDYVRLRSERGPDHKHVQQVAEVLKRADYTDF